MAQGTEERLRNLTEEQDDPEIGNSRKPQPARKQQESQKQAGFGVSWRSWGPGFYHPLTLQCSPSVDPCQRPTGKEEPGNRSSVAEQKMSKEGTHRHQLRGQHVDVHASQQSSSETIKGPHVRSSSSRSLPGILTPENKTRGNIVFDFSANEIIHPNHRESLQFWSGPHVCFKNLLTSILCGFANVTGLSLLF